MATRKQVKKESTPALTIDDIKRAAITAMFVDNHLFELLVLKGGNALDLIHKLSSRASIDLDFSMKHDVPDGDVDAFCERIEHALAKTFDVLGLVVFDVKMEEKPEQLSSDLADFWGGYAVEFKLVAREIAREFGGNLDELRKRALSLGRGKKFLIDISRFEYIDGSEERDLDGFRIVVYSPEMIVCEKLRALCQQMPEYAAVIRRARASTARARDFLDIFVLMDTLHLDLLSDKNRHLLPEMFRAKRVPMRLLGNLGNFRDFHRAEFPAVSATVKPDVKLEPFDFYFDYVLGVVDRLKPLWDV